jgi:hypothetical protein
MVSLNVGDSVAVQKGPQNSSRYYNATVTHPPRELDGAVRVHFPLFGPSWDEWVDPARLRPPIAEDGQPAAAAAAGSFRVDATSSRPGPGLRGRPQPQRTASAASRQLSPGIAGPVGSSYASAQQLQQQQQQQQQQQAVLRHGDHAPRASYTAPAPAAYRGGADIEGDISSLRRELSEERKQRMVLADRLNECFRMSEAEREQREVLASEVRGVMKNHTAAIQEDGKTLEKALLDVQDLQER